MSRDEIDIDIRLRRALSSAPDAGVEPPAALDEAIRSAAHAAIRKPSTVAPTARPGLGERLRRWWINPAFAPALAVVAVSTLVVALWNRGRDDSLEAPPEATRVAKAPIVVADRSITAAPVPTAPPFEEANQRVAAASRQVDELRLTPSAPSPAKGDAATSKQAVVDKASPTRGTAQRKLERESTTVAEAKVLDELRALRQETQSAKAPTSDGSGATPGSVAESAAMSAASATAATTAATTVTAASNTGVAAPPAAPVPAAVVASSPAPGRSAQQGRTPESAAAASAFAPPTSAGSSRDRRAATDEPPWPRVQELDASWRWRRGTIEALQPFDDDRLRGWIQRLTTATQNRWVRAEGAGSAAPSGALADDRKTIELWQGESLWATIVVGPSTASWTDATGRTWLAPLRGDLQADLRRIFATR